MNVEVSIRLRILLLFASHLLESNHMKANVDIIVLPYESAKHRSLLHLLIDELQSQKWIRFQAAIAFAKQSGNYLELVNSMLTFAEGGGEIDITFGADVFGPEAGGTEYAALKTLLTSLGNQPTVKLNLYHEARRTFHPKIYLFSNEPKNVAVVYIGSSNWSAGGFHGNVEANVRIEMDLTKPDNKQCYEYLQRLFLTYWSGLE